MLIWLKILYFKFMVKCIATEATDEPTQAATPIGNELIYFTICIVIILIIRIAYHTYCLPS